MKDDEIREKIAGKRIVASISGGKDSAAMSLYLTELGIEHDRIFMDTGWEHSSTYEYLRGPLTKAIGSIKEIRGKMLMPELILHKGMFPSRLRRFCTSELKIYPLQKHIAWLDCDVVNSVGIRSEESMARRMMLEWEWCDGFNCETWRPILGWTMDDVVAIHRRHGLRPHPLYLAGATRVGCWPCIFARKAEIRLLADIDPARVDTIRELEKKVGDAAKARSKAKGKDLVSGPCWFASRTSRKSLDPIDKAVTWSRTAHGGKQIEVFAADSKDSGCVRWGLCDAGHVETEES